MARLRKLGPACRPGRALSAKRCATLGSKNRI